MNTKFFPVIDLAATGNNIRRLRIKSYSEQQEDACCSSHFYARLFRMRQKSDAA